MLIFTELSVEVQALVSILRRFKKAGMPTSENCIRNSAYQYLIANNVCCHKHLLKAVSWEHLVSSVKECNPKVDFRNEIFNVPSLPNIPLVLREEKNNSLFQCQILYIKVMRFAVDKKSRSILLPLMFSKKPIPTNDIDILTVVCTFSTCGKKGPGMILYPRHYLTNELRNSVDNLEVGKNWVVGLNNNGVIDEDLFASYLQGAVSEWKDSGVFNNQGHTYLIMGFADSTISPERIASCLSGVKIIMRAEGEDPCQNVDAIELSVCDAIRLRWGDLVREWASTKGPLYEHNFAPFIVETIYRLTPPFLVQSISVASGFLDFNKDRMKFFKHQLKEFLDKWRF